MTRTKPSIGHVCPNCINAVFWAHREALERVLDISNTTGENEDVKRRGMADAAFECLSFFDLYYNGCLHYKTGTLKDHEIWLDGNAKALFREVKETKE
jgi:hypothetical protein